MRLGAQEHSYHCPRGNRTQGQEIMVVASGHWENGSRQKSLTPISTTKENVSALFYFLNEKRKINAVKTLEGFRKRHI